MTPSLPVLKQVVSHRDIRIIALLSFRITMYVKRWYFAEYLRGAIEFLSFFIYLEVVMAQRHKGVSVMRRMRVRFEGMNYYFLLFLLRSGTKVKRPALSSVILHATPCKIR